MLKKIIFQIIKYLSYIPFLKYVFKYFYLYSLRKIKEEYKDKENIKDIILTSSLKSKDFIYGHSDLNFLIVVENDCHPKSVLKDFRKFVQTNFTLVLTVNDTYIPILTESELNTDVIKSFLIRKSYQDLVKWNSILTDKEYIFYLRKQDHYAITFNSFQNLDYYLLRNKTNKSYRVKFKNLYRSLQNLKKFHPDYFPQDATWKRLCLRGQFFPILLPFINTKILKKSWSVITNYKVNLDHVNEKKYIGLPQDFINYLNSVTRLEFIDDFTLTPSIIQNSSDEIHGKLFIDIHVNQLITRKRYIAQLDNLKQGIKAFEKDHIKYRVRFTTDSIYKLQNQYSFYPFPLEPLYRKKKTHSINQKNYNFVISHESIIFGSIHFLTTQFMRFRSLQQKTDLIGSRFIKSLNLMYKYYLLAEYLKGNEFKLETSEAHIREYLTPQFSDIKLDDEVTEENWKIIKAQLLYLLKEIRDELIKYDSSLKLLKF